MSNWRLSLVSYKKIRVFLYFFIFDILFLLFLVIIIWKLFKKKHSSRRCVKIRKSLFQRDKNHEIKSIQLTTECPHDWKNWKTIILSHPTDWKNWKKKSGPMVPIMFLLLSFCLIDFFLIFRFSLFVELWKVESWFVRFSSHAKLEAKLNIT